MVPPDTKAPCRRGGGSRPRSAHRRYCHAAGWRADDAAAGVDQNVWSLRNLGFDADPYRVVNLNDAPTDPLLSVRRGLQPEQLAVG